MKEEECTYEEERKRKGYKRLGRPEMTNNPTTTKSRQLPSYSPTTSPPSL